MDDLRIRRGLVIPAGELRAAASRSSGPGGQHVNKSNTRVTLRWNIETSEVLTDRQRALLRSRLDQQLTRGGELVLHAGRIATKASAGARERQAQQKKHRSAIKSQRRRPKLDD
jgi:ribosome-associated protein